MKAWELLSDPAKWTKGAIARSADGNKARPSSKDACQWCVIGALTKCSADFRTLIKSVFMIENKVGVNRLNDWNDAPERTHAEVLAVLKELDI